MMTTNLTKSAALLALVAALTSAGCGGGSEITADEADAKIARHVRVGLRDQLSERAGEPMRVRATCIAARDDLRRFTCYAVTKRAGNGATLRQDTIDVTCEKRAAACVWDTRS